MVGTNNILMRLTADEHQMVNSLLKVARAQGAVERSARSTGAAIDKQGKSFAGLQKSFAGIAGALGGFVSAGAAIGLATNQMAKFRDESRGAADALLASAANMKRLTQISKGDPARLASFLDTARGLQVRYGMSRDEALGTVFSGTSLGFSESDIMRLGRSKSFSQDVQPIFEGVAGIRTAFGEKATGKYSNEAIVNAMLAAAEPSKVGVEDIAGQSLVAAQSIKKIGGTFQELVAALGVVSPALKSTEEAAVSIGRFADIVRRNPELATKGLLGSLELLATKTDEQIQEIVGENVRADRGARILLENIDKLREVLASIGDSLLAAGTESSRFRQAAALGEGAGEVGVATRAERARQFKESAISRQFATPQSQRDAMYDIVSGIMVRDTSGMTRNVKRMGLRATKFFSDNLNAEVGESGFLQSDFMDFMTPLNPNQRVEAAKRFGDEEFSALLLKDMLDSPGITKGYPEAVKKMIDMVKGDGISQKEHGILYGEGFERMYGFLARIEENTRPAGGRAFTPTPSGDTE